MTNHNKELLWLFKTGSGCIVVLVGAWWVRVHCFVILRQHRLGLGGLNFGLGGVLDFKIESGVVALDIGVHGTL